MENDESYIEYIMDCIDPKRIVQFLANEKLQIKAAALRIVGSAATLDVFAEDFIHCGCLKALKSIITSRSMDASIIREGCWALSNIAAGPHSHIQHLISEGIINILISLITGSSVYPIKEEAGWVVANVCTEGNDIQIWQMVKDGILSALLFMLNSKDVKLLSAILDAVDKVIDVGNTGTYNQIAGEWQALGGVEKMESLQLQKNEKIYESVIKIMEKHYQLAELEGTDA